MTIAYFDCFSGVAGDMILGSFIDIGLPLSLLKKELKKLPMGKYQIKCEKKHGGISGFDVNVIIGDNDASFDYKKIDYLIARSALKKNVKDLSRSIFEKVASAEAKVHKAPMMKVHFHEVGAVDSVVDIVGAAIGFDYFNFKAVYSSPMPFSRGKIKCEHGILPCPAPATLEILKNVPWEKTKIKGELVTPTGAAIIATVAENFGECPLHTVKKIGYGYGDRVIPGMINAVRLMVGEGFPVVVIQADIDDMNPQLFDNAIDKIFKAGVVDLSIQPVQMKKNRPAVRLEVIVPWDNKDKVIDCILKETTTFGVRYFDVNRKILRRELIQKKVKRGQIHFKIGYDETGRIIKTVPEYDDMKRLAKKTGRSILELYQNPPIPPLSKGE